MLKILHVIESMGRGGAERQLANILGPLTELGVENHLATLRREHAYEERVAPFIARSSIGLWEEQPFTALAKLSALARAVDVVHTHLPWADIAGRFAAVTARKPGFSTLHTTWYAPENVRRLPSSIQRKVHVVRTIDALTGRSVVRFFAVSDAVRETYVSQLHFPRARIDILPNSVDLTRFDPSRFGSRDAVRAELGFGPKVFVILVVARLAEGKDHATVIRAAAHLQSSSPIRLYFVGVGPLEPQLQQLSRELSAPVTFLGARDDVPKVLFASDLFMLPTFYEGMSLALMEAMAMGLPCVCSDIPENRSVGAEHVVYVPPGDPDALSACMMSLIENHRWREELGRNARLQAQSFDAHIVAKRLLTAIQVATDRV